MAKIIPDWKYKIDQIIKEGFPTGRLLIDMANELGVAPATVRRRARQMGFIRRKYTPPKTKKEVFKRPVHNDDRQIIEYANAHPEASIGQIQKAFRYRFNTYTILAALGPMANRRNEYFECGDLANMPNPGGMLVSSSRGAERL